MRAGTGRAWLGLVMAGLSGAGNGRVRWGHGMAGLLGLRMEELGGGWELKG